LWSRTLPFSICVTGVSRSRWREGARSTLVTLRAGIFGDLCSDLYQEFFRIVVPGPAAAVRAWLVMGNSKSKGKCVPVKSKKEIKLEKKYGLDSGDAKRCADPSKIGASCHETLQDQRAPGGMARHYAVALQFRRACRGGVGVAAGEAAISGGCRVLLFRQGVRRTGSRLLWRLRW
jgi:hypothetical protein